MKAVIQLLMSIRSSKGTRYLLANEDLQTRYSRNAEDEKHEVSSTRSLETIRLSSATNYYEVTISLKILLHSDRVQCKHVPWLVNMFEVMKYFNTSWSVRNMTV